jgi:hypothetical protein
MQICIMHMCMKIRNAGKLGYLRIWLRGQEAQADGSIPKLLLIAPRHTELGTWAGRVATFIIRVYNTVWEEHPRVARCNMFLT